MKPFIYSINFTLLILFGGSLELKSQGWVGNGGNNLSAVNSSLSSTPISIGIGTNAPTAQLHTTGTLRFDNLVQAATNNRVLVTDLSGNVFWRDASTIGTTNAWLLNGNAGTTSANFLGTTDNQNLSFRTNNLQRMTIRGSNGFVGIGVANPQVRLHVSDNLGAMGFPYETAIIERGTDAKLGVYSSHPNPIGGTQGASLALGFTNYRNSQNLYPGFEMQYLVNTATTSALRFNAISRDINGNVSQTYTNIMVMNDAGRVGINLGPATFGFPNLPTAVLHTNGNVRHENLGQGTGNIVVIDANGNLFRSNQTAFADDSKEILKLKEDILSLRKEIATIKKDVLGSLAIKTSGQINEEAILFQNEPNPFTNETLIRYSLPKTVQNAKILITNPAGLTIKEYNLKNTEQFIKIRAYDLSSGIYFYSLFSNNKLVDSKKMILTH